MLLAAGMPATSTPRRHRARRVTCAVRSGALLGGVVHLTHFAIYLSHSASATYKGEAKTILIGIVLSPSFHKAGLPCCLVK